MFDIIKAYLKLKIKVLILPITLTIIIGIIVIGTIGAVMSWLIPYRFLDLVSIMDKDVSALDAQFDLNKKPTDADYDNTYDVKYDPEKLTFVEDFRSEWGFEKPLNDHERKMYDKIDRLTNIYQKKLSGINIYRNLLMATVIIDQAPTPTTDGQGDYVRGEEDVPNPDEPKVEVESECIDIPDYLSEYEDPWAIKMYLDPFDNCEYNLENAYSIDFSMGYTGMPGVPPDVNPEKGTSPVDHWFLDEYVEADTLRGLVNQMLEKEYQCLFEDYRIIYDENDKPIGKTVIGYQNGQGVNIDGKTISFPVVDNIFQVGYYRAACKFFQGPDGTGEKYQPELLPGATNRAIADLSSTYLLDRDKYINYLKESEFLEKRFPSHFSGVEEDDKAYLKRKLVERIEELEAAHNKDIEEQYYYSPGTRRKGSPGSGISNNTYNNVQNGLVWPSCSKNITGRFNDSREGYLHGAVDIAATHGSTIKSIGKGKVSEIVDAYTWRDSCCSSKCAEFNNYIVIEYPIEHNGKETVLTVTYAHISEVWPGITVGSDVDIGQPIAKVGNTGYVCDMVGNGPSENNKTLGSHIHLEIIDDSGLVDPFSILNMNNTSGC